MSAAAQKDSQAVANKTEGTQAPTEHTDAALQDTSADAEAEGAEQPEIAQEEISYKLTIKAPNGAEVPVIATLQETIMDLKQVVSETPATIEYSCFYLAYQGQRINDFSELGEIEGLPQEAELDLVEDQYTEREVRLHVTRLRDLLAGPTTANPGIAGLDAGVSIFGDIKYPEGIKGDLSSAVEGAGSTTGDSGSENVSHQQKSKGGKGGKGAKNAAASQESRSEKNESESEASAAAEKARQAALSEHAFKDYEIGKVSPFSVVSAQKAISKLALPQCLKQVILSGWNPVPRYRQLKGDLLYLTVTTLETQTYHITASRSGFYVNSSSLVRFSPEPFAEAHAGQPGVRNSAHYSAHSLITLLKRLSPRFARGFAELQKESSQREIFEVLPFVAAEQAATPWLVRDRENRVPATYDLGNPQDVYLRLGAQAADSLRDWNEELQSIREMPRVSLQERVLRDRQLHKWYSEFADAAVQGAIAVVEGEMLPLNPNDAAEQHMFLRDNVFYSKGFDGRETFAGLGGDAAAHVATGKDITGVRMVNQLDVEGLHTLGSVVVDYRGVRVVAQSVVPGIFRRQETTQIVYGSVDSGVTVGASEEFHKLLEPVAKALHYGEHAVTDEAGAEHKLYTSVDVKGLMGTDGRKYVLDLYRMTPVDVEFLESDCADAEGDSGSKDSAVLPVYPHRLALLRPELLDVFWDTSLRKAVQEYAQEKAAKKSEETKEGEEKESEGAKAQEEGDKAEADNMADFEFSLEFNPDAFTPVEQNAKDQGAEPSAALAAVRNASKFLRDISIPAFARELATYTVSPLSGGALSTAMHQRGINMRYLGKIASLLPRENESVVNVRRVVIFEIIARSIKHIVRRLLRETPAHLHGEAFALVANALLGSKRCKNPAAYLSAEAKQVSALAELTPASLIEEIKAQAALRFRYNLEADFVQAYVAGSEHVLLRELAIKVGAQLAMREYHFEEPSEAAVYTETVLAMGLDKGKLSKNDKRLVRERVDQIKQRELIVEADDVMNFVALTKVSKHNSSFADEAFEAGHMSLGQGQRETGLELLLESLTLHEQTFGFLHSESARCYAVVSLAHYDAGQFELAAEFMTKAVIISERTVGLDDPLTIHNYLNLALYEHARGNVLLALRLMRHALDLWGLINSPDHPDLATAHNNIGVMLQSLRLYDDALKFIQSSYEIRLKLQGPECVPVANAQHALAKAYALTGDFKAAVQMERDAHKYFSEKFGDEDPRSKETAEWLAELTFNAVRTAKLTKAAREKLTLAAAAANELVQMDRANAPQDAAGPAGAPAATGATGSKGHLPIDDLLKFITGTGNTVNKPRPSGGRRSKGAPKGSRR
ncbi:Intracellular distribution of mitochondria [Coemansia sp. Benny D115]|nr:Intracellular distribution of mitochondria [Coemansia sp. Benny D115]